MLLTMLKELIYLLSLISREVNVTATEDILSTPQRLFNDLFKNYNKALRPVFNQSQPISVSIHFWFKQILKVDEIDQIMTVYCWLEEFWTDQYLKWEPKDYDGIDLLHVPAEMIWKPDILVYNGASMNTKENELETNAVVKSTGEVMLFKAVITDIACNLDMTYFPFDQQVCFIMLASWSHDGSKIRLNLREAKSYLDFYISNSEWTLLDFKVTKHSRTYECCPDPYPELLYYFALERNPAYYILSLIIPSAFITVVTIVGFFTPHSSTGETTEKVSLGVTALLSLAIILLMVADKMPATSKVMPLIGKYYIGLIFLIFMAACTTTVTLTIQLSGNSMKPPRSDLKYILMKMARFLWVSTEGIELDEHPGKYFRFDHTTETAFLIPPHASYQNENLNVGPVYPVNFTRNYVTRQSNSKKKSTTEFNNINSLLPEQKLKDVFEKIETNVNAIGEHLKMAELRQKVRREWAFVTRITERFLMIFYIILTLGFAFVMLSTRGMPVILNEKVLAKIVN